MISILRSPLAIWPYLADSRSNERALYSFQFLSRFRSVFSRLSSETHTVTFFVKLKAMEQLDFGKHIIDYFGKSKAQEESKETVLKHTFGPVNTALVWRF